MARGAARSHLSSPIARRRLASLGTPDRLPTAPPSRRSSVQMNRVPGAVRSPANPLLLPQTPPSAGGPTAAPSRGYTARAYKIIPSGPTRLRLMRPALDTELRPVRLPPPLAG